MLQHLLQDGYSFQSPGFVLTSFHVFYFRYNGAASKESTVVDGDIELNVLIQLEVENCTMLSDSWSFLFLAELLLSLATMTIYNHNINLRNNIIMKYMLLIKNEINSLYI